MLGQDKSKRIHSYMNEPDDRYAIIYDLLLPLCIISFIEVYRLRQIINAEKQNLQAVGDNLV